MFQFGKTSLARLQTCDERLQRVVHRALNYGVIDISVLCGHRTLQEQQDAFYNGSSTLDGINKKSKHQSYPSIAVDVAPYVAGGIDWGDADLFKILAGLMFAAAAEEGIKLRWGGDWDMDWDMHDQNFDDLPHFEIVE